MTIGGKTFVGSGFLQADFQLTKISHFKKIFSDIYAYSTASTDDAAFIIGGITAYNTIAEFRNNQWRNLGSLTKGRAYHGSIAIGQETMIIGGYTPDGS